MMGDLHILFTFLKVIGQHIENAGPDDIWLKSTLFADNTTDAMKEG